MRKIIWLFLSLLLIVSFCTVSTVAASSETLLELPSDDGTGYPVTGITDSYNNNDDITKLIVPNNIVRVGECAFFGCSNLNQISLHDKVQVIGENAFKDTAYYEDEDNWENGVLYIGDCLIEADPKMVSGAYTVKPGTRLIADGAFKDCKELSSIIIPDSVEYVGTDAFVGTAYFLNKNNWVNNALFLKHVLVSFDKEYRGSYFVPRGIKTIADGAFVSSKVTKVTTPDSMRYIGYNAFGDCRELNMISIGKAVETLGRGPFRMCTELKAINVHVDNEHFVVVGNVLYDKQLSTVIRCPQKLVGKVVLPNSIMRINAYAFEWCDEIKNVSIPEGCVFIGNSAFSSCKNLEDVVIPETMEYIDSAAFSHCESIETVTIPDYVHYLGRKAFSYCTNLRDVQIGKGVTELRSSLFECCEKLNGVILGENIVEIDASVFYSTKYLIDVSNYKNGLLILSDKYLIKVGQDVTSCYIPSGIKVIADGAFEYLSEESVLSSIHIPSSVINLNCSAFYGVSNTIPVYYDGTVKEFEDIANYDLRYTNLYTNDYYVAIWSIVVLVGVYCVFTIGVWGINYKKKEMSNYKSEG